MPARPPSGAAAAWEVWGGSLDAMPRNFDRRYELFFPILDPRAKAYVLAELRAQLDDDVNAWELHADGSQAPLWEGRATHSARTTTGGGWPGGEEVPGHGQ